MPNTYLNDLLTSPYPFFGDAALPFSQACILGLGVCIRSNTSVYPIYATSISIGLSSVYMVLCHKKTSGNITKNVIIGTLFADTARSDRTGLLVTAPDIEASGFLTLGTITEADVGQYEGEFHIDPSCVSYMPDTLYGKHNTLELNGNTVSLGQIFVLGANGLLTIQDTCIKGTADAKTADLYSFASEHIYDAHVTSVNGVYTGADGTTGTLRLIGGTGITFYTDLIPTALELTAEQTEPDDRALYEGCAVVVVINGNTAFPSCYSVGDQANTVTPYSM